MTPSLFLLLSLFVLQAPPARTVAGHRKGHQMVELPVRPVEGMALPQRLALVDQIEQCTHTSATSASAVFCCKRCRAASARSTRPHR